MSGTSIIKISELNKASLQLGEGVYYSKQNNLAAWVDILKKKIYYHDFKLNKTKTHKSKNYPSCILEINNANLTFLDSEGISILNIFNNLSHQQIRINEIANHNNIRGNDGISFEKKIFFGSMEYEPKDNQSGGIYAFENKKIIKIDNVGIPNTFIVFNNKILISDSYEKTIYQYDLKNYKKKVWLDLSRQSLTPDGGCLSRFNTVIICMWGSGLINEYCLEGNLLNSYSVPVKNPTNCCFIANNKLLVTSASVDCDERDYKKWPLSGKTIILELST